MMTTIKNLRYLGQDGRFHAGEITMRDERFVAVRAEVEKRNNEYEDARVVDGQGFYAIPGLIDTHFHGCVHYDFCAGTEQAMNAIARYEASRGVTTLVPATMSYDEAILSRISHCYAHHKAGDGAEFHGIHMEGPFINPGKCGAQNPAYIQPPNLAMFDRLQQEAAGAYRIVTLAPEEPGAMDFIERRRDSVSLSIGHTEADYDTAAEAFRRGANRLTHCCNAMPELRHRSPGPIAAAAECGQVWIELICDGVHIAAPIVRLLFKIFGAERIVMISDSMEATGLCDGVYSLGGQEVRVEGNEARLKNGALAGSVTDLLGCLKAAAQMGIPLETAVRCATINPARSIGLENEYGSIESEKYANLVLLDDALDVKAVYLKGEKYCG